MELSKKYREVRKRTEFLCNPLQHEDYVPQIAEFVSPPKWHLAHSTWFFEEFILSPLMHGYKKFDNDFSFLFNSYYNFFGERTIRGERGNITRPGVQKVYDYRKYVDKHMLQLLESKHDQEIFDRCLLGLNHEQQHQELLITDLKYLFGHNPTFPEYDLKTNLVNDVNVEFGHISFEEGIYEIGHLGDDFHFDNEVGRHKVYLQNFEISKSLVTNKEYLEFIDDGGYANFKFWLDEGWEWVQKNNIKAPLYWHKIDNVWHLYTLSGLKHLEPEAILTHISYYEANAFAQWKQMRLPTEYEWEVAADNFTWGQRWEWTNSAYLPYPNFKITEGALGEYNGKFMINQMVLRGASGATSKGHSRKTYRNFFHPHYQWQFTGIRLAKHI